LVRDGRVLVNGFPVTNPAALVRRDASIVVVEPRPLRGERKLGLALSVLAIDVGGRVVVDVGAAAGGFTKALLDAGARRVYAVDAGYGQLLGSLRADPRVVNLERLNLAELHAELVPERVELISIDLSYLSLAEAVPQLEPLTIADDARLIALVKPQFELGLPTPPTDRGLLDDAVRRAASAINAGAWVVEQSVESPVRGSRGAIEFFVSARRRGF
jgi:23S rRNA (cytidine1920-2'-O)/16S rRNA (cytidine1409-2'-O)-methyltransferase